MQHVSLAIPGCKKSTERFLVKSPYSGASIASVERSTAAQHKVVLANAMQCSKEGAPPAHARAELLYALSKKVAAHKKTLATLVAKEGGKPLTDARIEIDRAVNTIKMCGDAALTLNGKRISMDRSPGTEGHTAFTVCEPVGPVLAISAFNHPFNLTAHLVAPAIAAGCPVVLKPASFTPLSSLFFRKLALSCGVSPKALQVVTPKGADTEPLVSSSVFRHVSFIGSSKVGLDIKKKVAAGVGVTLEHGGTAHAIVDESAELSKVIPAITRGAFYHAGQVCVSTQNVLVHQNIYASFLARFIKATRLLKVGDPTRATTDVGPLITPQEADRVDSLVKEAVAAGATVALGGKLLPKNCYAPTILTGVTSSMKVVHEEVFGPVVTVRPFRTLSKATSKAHNPRFCFQAAVFTSNINTAFSMAKNISARTVIVNDATTFRVDWMPFGGSYESGEGLGGTEESVKALTHEKLIVIKNHSKI